jgi:hypothetical protein
MGIAILATSSGIRGLTSSILTIAAWVRKIGGAAKLENNFITELSLGATPITDAQVGNISGLKRLRKLDLEGTEVCAWLNSIGVTGISWGGYLTCIVAGVDRRFRLAVPVYGCGFYRDTIFQNELNKITPADAERWLSWWDPSVYLSAAEMPMLWVTGSNDFAYTLNALQSSYRLPKGLRTLCIRLRMPHAHGGAGENPEEIRVFADHLLGKGPPLARIRATGASCSSLMPPSMCKKWM